MRAAAFALEIGAPLLFKPHPNPYVHGWGQAMANAKKTIATWDVELFDLNENEFRLKFDIIDGDEPLVIGDSVLIYSNHIRLSDKPSLVIKTPTLDKEIEFASYSNSSEYRPRLFIVPPESKNKSSMIGKASKEKAAVKATEFLVRKILCYRHDTAHDMRRCLSCRISTNRSLRPQSRRSSHRVASVYNQAVLFQARKRQLSTLIRTLTTLFSLTSSTPSMDHRRKLTCSFMHVVPVPDIPKYLMFQAGI